MNNLRFSVLLKDTVTPGQEEVRICSTNLDTQGGHIAPPLSTNYENQIDKTYWCT